MNLSTSQDSSGYNLYNKKKSQNFQFRKFANVKKYLVCLELPDLTVDKSKKILKNYLITGKPEPKLEFNSSSTNMSEDNSFPTSLGFIIFVVCIGPIIAILSMLVLAIWMLYCLWEFQSFQQNQNYFKPFILSSHFQRQFQI